MKANVYLRQKFDNVISSIFERQLTGNIYQGIATLPIHNWWMIHEKSDFSYLLIRPRKLNIFHKRFLSRVWRNIYDEYIKRFGFSKLFIEIMEKKQEIYVLKCQRIETGDDSMNLFIEVAKKELEELEKRSKADPMSMYQSKLSMEKILGFRLDPKVVPVEEYYSYIEGVKKLAEKIPHKNGREHNQA